MNEQVIEAAAKAEYDRVQSVHGTGFTWNQLLPDIRASWIRSAATMIRAADEARAEQGFVLVKRDDLRFVLDEFGWRELRYGSLGIETAHARLTAALGDGEHGTETE